MLKDLLIIAGIILVTALTINNTVNKYKETEQISIITPAQNEMRQPARQNPGQNQQDVQTQKARNNKTNRHWNNNPNNNSSKNDNFNRNPNRKTTN